MLNTFEAFTIFCALTIGGGIMALPMAMSLSGWIPSIITLCTVPFYYWKIYSFLIDLMQKKDNTHLHILITDCYGQRFSLFSSALIIGHIFFLLCFMIIREAKLIRFTLTWTSQEFVWLSPSLIDFIESKELKQWTALCLCLLMLKCGDYRGFRTFRWISLLSLAVWIYFILLAAKDILFNDKIKFLSVQAYNHEETDKIVWGALESFNSIHGFALLHYDIKDANITRKAIKYGLWVILLINFTVAWLGSSFHLGDLNWMSMVHIGLGSKNLKVTPFSWLIFIGLIASIASLFILSLLLLNQVRTSLAHLMDYKGKHFTQDTFNRKSPLMIFIGFLLVGTLVFSFDNIPLLITVRRAMLFIFSILYPYLIYAKEEGSKLKKIIYGLLIVLFFIFVCSYIPEIQAIFNKIKEI